MRAVFEDIEVEVWRSHVKIPVIFLVPALLLGSLYALLYLGANSDWARGQLHGVLDGVFPGQIRADELVVEPDLRQVHVWGASLHETKDPGPATAPLIAVREAHVTLNPLTLINRRLDVTSGRVRGAKVRMHMNEQGELALLRALGLYELPEPDPDEPPGQMPLAFNFADIHLEGSFEMVFDGIFELQIPDVSIERGEVHIDSDNLLMEVPQARAGRAEFRFYHELFGFEPAAGDWTFTVHDFLVDEWRWSNMGYTVERVRADVEGYQVDAHGQMGFPDSEEVMTFKAGGELSAPLWSPLTQYFVDDMLHYSIPHMSVQGEGTINWVESRAELEADYFEAIGFRARDLRADLALHDSTVEILEGAMSLYGGRAHIEHAYFDMFELVYGGVGSFEGVDPAPLLRDLEFDYPFMAGQMRGRLRAEGKVPRDYAFEPGRNTLLAHARDRWVEVELLEDAVLERANRELLPNRTLTAEAGTQIWMDLDRVGIPEGVVRLDEDRVKVTDLVLNYTNLTYEPYYGEWGGRLQADFASLGPYLRHYEVEGIDTGRALVDVRARGPLMAPTGLEFELQAQDPQAGEALAGQRLQTSFGIRDGRIDVRELELVTKAGAARVTGWLDILRTTPEPDPEWEQIIYVVREDGPLSLDVGSEAISLGALEPWLPEGVGLEGVAALEGLVRGQLDALLVCGRTRADDLVMAGEPLAHVELEATMRDAGVRQGCPWLGAAEPPIARAPNARQVELERLHIEHVRAGSLRAQGRYGFDDRFEIDVRSPGLEPGALEALEGAGLRGRAELALRGQGTLQAPHISGSLRGRGFGVGELALGDLALAVDTITRTEPPLDPGGEPFIERTVHVNGALLPWTTLALELPLDQQLPPDQRAPVYARVGIERLDLLEMVAGTAALEYLTGSSVEARALRAQLERLERARASGDVELFVPQQGGGFTVLATLPELIVGPGRDALRNAEPIVVSYVSEEAGEDRVGVESFSLGDGDHFVSTRGSFTPEDGFLDLVVDGELNLGILSLLKRVAPQWMPEELVRARGLVRLETRLSGTPEALATEGLIEWEPSEFVVRSLADPVILRGGAIELSPEAITVPEARPLDGSILGGDFAIDGQLALRGYRPGALELNLWTHNISYGVPEVANVTLDTDLRLRAGDLASPETWKVSGSVDILDGRFYQDISVFERELTNRVLGAFERRTEVYEASLFEEFPELAEVEFDLALRARDGFKLTSKIERFDLDMELRIDLRLTSTLIDPKLNGDVEVIDGAVTFQGQRFKVRNGMVRFEGDPGNPLLDVVAVAEIRNACRESAVEEQFVGNLALNGAVTTAGEVQDEIYQVSLNVSGYSDNLDIVYDSTPFADQRDIISLILTGCTVDLLTASSASQPTLETLLGPLIGRLEREIQDVVRVEEFNIVPGVERTQVRISDSLTQRLSWQFRLDKAFNEASSTGQYAELEYQLSDRWAALVSESTYSDLNTASRFQVDLKLKYRVPLD